ncbi:MAG: gas vesicle protein [Syntrophobacteraceae bacterium]
MPDFSPADVEHVSLCEALDRILNKGAVVVGEIRISVADIDLIYLGLQVVLSSVNAARDVMCPDGKCDRVKVRAGYPDT